MATKQGVGSTSSDIYGRLMDVQKNLDPYLANAGQAPQFFDNKINEMFNYNKPAIQNAAALESRAYSLPGELMDQYTTEYGGNLGVGGMSRMNSILKNIGNQFGLSNSAWNIVDQAKLRQGDLSKRMLDQYGAETGALQQRHNMLLPLWQQMYSEEQANKRAAMGRTPPTPPIDIPAIRKELGLYEEKQAVPSRLKEPSFLQRVNSAVKNIRGGLDAAGLPGASSWIGNTYNNVANWLGLGPGGQKY